MIEIRRILCPVDYSDFSRRALDHAVAIARWYGSTVTVFHVCALLPAAAFAPGPLALTATPLAPEGREALLGRLRSFADVDVSGSGVQIEFEVAEGSTAAEILQKAEADSSDLIVLGTHGHSGFDRLVLGSVAERVLRKASCPVLTIPCHAPDAASVPSKLFRRILCAIDFSDCSIAAMHHAISLAKEADAQLTLLSVVDIPVGLWPATEAPTPLPAELRNWIDAAECERSESLNALIPSEARAYCTISTVVATGTPYRRILSAASDLDAGLIVMGVRGRGAADLLLFGSTTQRVVRLATCPVLTIAQ